MDREETSNHIVLEVQWNVDENVIYTVLFSVLQEGWGELKMNRFSVGVPSFSTFASFCPPSLLFRDGVCLKTTNAHFKLVT